MDNETGHPGQGHGHYSIPKIKIVQKDNLEILRLGCYFSRPDEKLYWSKSGRRR